MLSDVRSGSTLLDQCLGAHPQIASLGEVHWLPAYVSQDRKLYDPEHPLVCSCGRAVAECPFWRGVAAQLGRPLGSLRLHSKHETDGTGRRAAPSRTWPARQLLRHFPVLFRNGAVRGLLGGQALARESIALFDAVAKATGRPLCVDSSKSPLRFRSVHALQPDRTFAIVLSRDYRAVVHSKMKRGARLAVAAAGWRRKMQQIAELTDDLPPDRVYRLKYEELCEDPRLHLSRLCSFLGVEFAEAMVERPSDDVHHIGGSPSKFDPSRTRIELDRSHADRFEGPELEQLRKLVGREAARWGY